VENSKLSTGFKQFVERGMTNKFKKCHFRAWPENPFNCNTRDCRV